MTEIKEVELTQNSIYNLVIYHQELTEIIKKIKNVKQNLNISALQIDRNINTPLQVLNFAQSSGDIIINTETILINPKPIREISDNLTLLVRDQKKTIRQCEMYIEIWIHGCEYVEQMSDKQIKDQIGLDYFTENYEHFKKQEEN